ncbi:MAG: hypothetical protein QM756_30850 [Polyangiaceae bacterium]
MSLRGALFLPLCLLFSCRSPQPDNGVERVEFGVPFGGDIQDRAQIPLDLESRELLLRVTFKGPLPRERLLGWELERPSTQRGADGGLLFAAEVGEARVPAGESRAEAKLAFRRTDPPGPWRIRARLDGQALFERTFEVLARDKR